MELLLTTFELGLLAASDFHEGIGKIVSMIQTVALLLCLAILIISAVVFATGRIEAAMWGLIAAGICGLSWTITKFAFAAGGTSVPDITLP